jgi:hypothetical protein
MTTSIKGDLIIYNGNIIYKKTPDFSDIKPGDKLRIYDDEMYIDKRSWIFRKISGDNRYKTLEFLNKQNLHYTLHNKIIDCLKVTYKNDYTFVDTLTKNQKSIQCSPSIIDGCFSGMGVGKMYVSTNIESNNGGCFTTTGGTAVKKDLYIGGLSVY